MTIERVGGAGGSGFEGGEGAGRGEPSDDDPRDAWEPDERAAVEFECAPPDEDLTAAEESGVGASMRFECGTSDGDPEAHFGEQLPERRGVQWWALPWGNRRR